MNFRHREPDVSPSGGGGPVILDKPLPAPDGEALSWYTRCTVPGRRPVGMYDYRQEPAREVAMRGRAMVNPHASNPAAPPPATFDQVREAVEAQRNIERRAVFDSRKRYVERWA